MPHYSTSSSSSSTPRHSPKASATSSRSSGSSRRTRRSNESYSTAASSPQSSPRCSPGKTHQEAKVFQEHEQWSYEDDTSPSTSLCDRSSTETFNSALASEDDVDTVDADAYCDDGVQAIPPLGDYVRDIVDPTVRPSNPDQFARLFPSTEKLTIRHDEFTSDGNMNLRVDMVVPGGGGGRGGGRHHHRVAVQLFHLRMHDLARRKFSLRRYCRESGREVCNSERKYEGGTPTPAVVAAAAPAAPSSGSSRPNLQRSVSTAFKFRRTNSGGSLFGTKPSNSHSHGSGSGSGKRPGSSSSSINSDLSERSATSERGGGAKKVATNTIKLEFSNYARVDVTRKGGGQASKHYDFEWWGHQYSWKRVYDKNLKVYSFHLVRDGASSAPVAHIVPESRSPTQEFVDESAGGWVPPCHMWISDESLIDTPTDIADVVVASGLMALVDNCIKERWQTKKSHRIAVPLTSRTLEFDHRKAFKPALLPRSHSDHHGSSPLRYATPIAAY